MTQNAPSWPLSHMQYGLARCSIILILVMSGFTAICLPLAIWLGDSSVAALLAAVAVCITPGLAALFVAHHFAAANRHLVGMLLAMGCRLMPPLVVCVWLALNKNAVHGQVFAGFLIGAYLVSLAVETYLSVRTIDTHHQLPLEG